LKPSRPLSKIFSILVKMIKGSKSSIVNLQVLARISFILICTWRKSVQTQSILQVKYHLTLLNRAVMVMTAMAMRIFHLAINRWCNSPKKRLIRPDHTLRILIFALQEAGARKKLFQRENRHSVTAMMQTTAKNLNSTHLLEIISSAQNPGWEILLSNIKNQHAIE
jgi:hypothetical protein